MSGTGQMRRKIGERLALELGADFRFFSSRNELRSKTDYGHQSIVIVNTAQFSPYTTLSFHFGLFFDAVWKIQREIEPRPSKPYYHLIQNSYSIAHMQGLNCSGPTTWETTVTVPLEHLIPEVLPMIKCAIFPFFERFGELGAARDAIANNDSWCQGGVYRWQTVMLMDVALSDKKHLRRWLEDLPGRFKPEVEMYMRKLEAAGFL